MTPDARQPSSETLSPPASPPSAAQTPITPLGKAIVTLATGGLIVAAAGVSVFWSMAQAVLGRRSLPWAGARAAYLAYQLLKTREHEQEPGDDAYDRAIRASATRAIDSVQPGAPPPPTRQERQERQKGQERQKTDRLARLREGMSKPAAGATIAGALVLGAASVLGITEAALGAVAAYGAYHLLAKAKRRTADVR